MKKVIEAIKEIISKDASTQTEPVTIVENEEESMSKGDTEGQTLAISNTMLKRDEYLIGIRKAKSLNIVSDKRQKVLSEEDESSEYLSGQDQVRSIEEEKEKIEELGQQQQVQPGASFYDKCKNYVAQIYPEEIDSSDFYSGIAGTLEWPIVAGNTGFNVEEFSQVLKNIFIYVAESTDDEETKQTDLILKAAGIYKVCADNQDIQDFMTANNATNFTDPGLLKLTIQGYLAAVTDYELAGEVFNFLDNIN